MCTEERDFILFKTPKGVMAYLRPQRRRQLLGCAAALTADIMNQAVAVYRLQEEERDRERAERAERAFHSREWIVRRPEFGAYDNLMQELRLEDEPAFRNFVRMDPRLFQEILDRVGPRIAKRDTKWRKAIQPGMRLAITLRYLATGNDYLTMMYFFRVASNTICLIIRQVCDALVEEFGQEVIAAPTTPEEWQPIADQFSQRWQFHHCLGALDGKHIAIKKPNNAGSVYYNYKGFHSIILFALVDADYKFVWIEVGNNGASSDAQIWNRCSLKKYIVDGRIGFPAPTPLPGDDQDMPYFLIGDDAFALETFLMKPFSRRNMERTERIFNYRLSRARRIVENAFGILAHRFRCLLTTMMQRPETVSSIVGACVCLHNMLRMRNPGAHHPQMDHEDDDHQVIDGAWRDGQNLHDMERNRRGGNLASRAARVQRDVLTAYYNSPTGAVAWQNNMV